MVTSMDIARGLADLGLSAGDKVMVHSSLKAFGRVDGGAHAVIHALMDVVSDRGTVLMPSFNHFAPFREGGALVYDPATTPTSNGAIPEAFRLLTGVMRSLNPSHPYAAWGGDARRLLERHHLTLTMGPESPLGMLGREGGYGLFLGTDYRTNTYKHVVETTLGAPCLGLRTMALPAILPTGERRTLRTWSYRDAGCAISDPNDPVWGVMESRRLHRRARIGQAEVVLLRLADCFAVLAELLTTGHGGFGPCAKCPVPPWVSPWQEPTDWDAQAGCLRPDSPCRDLLPMVYVRPQGAQRT